MAKPEKVKAPERKKVWLRNDGIPRRILHNYFEHTAGTVVPVGVSEVDEALASDCLQHWPNEFELVDGPPADAPPAAPAAPAAPPVDPNAQREGESLDDFIRRTKAQDAANKPVK